MTYRFKYLFLIIMLVLIFPKIIFSETLTASQILNRVDESLFPDSLIMEMKMINHDSSKRETEFIYQVKAIKDVGTLLIFKSPASEIGKKFLLKDRNIWMAIPGVSNPIRLSIRQNFMNSSFSNNDLMDTEYNDDYIPVLDDIIKLEGKDYYRIICKAKNPKVTYNKVVMIIGKDNFIPRRIEYYTRSGKLLKMLTLSDIKQLAGRPRPTKMVMRNQMEEDVYTTVIIESMEEKKNLPKSIFTLDSLRK